MIGPLAAIGAGTIVAPNAVIGRFCQIGRDCYVGPGASIQYALIGNRVIIHAGAKIGQDGFGFVAGARGPERIPQIGRVVIQDDVEIGANTTIDRGAMADTIIGEGTKIDNLVQIAHNVRIGRGCIIAGHCGISGSVTMGDYVMLGGRRRHRRPRDDRRRRAARRRQPGSCTTFRRASAGSAIRPSRWCDHARFLPPGRGDPGAGEGKKGDGNG